MDTGDGDFGEDEEAEPCEECGSVSRSRSQGYVYCADCGLRPADSQAQLTFDRYQEGQDGFMGYTVKRINTKKNKANLEYADMWTTWHAYNLVLIGLVDELINCGVKSPHFRPTVLFLWSRWLKMNRVAFYSKEPLYRPKIPLGAKKRDLKLMLGIEMPKKGSKKSEKSALENPSIKRVRGLRKSTAYQQRLVKQEYEEFKASQQSTSGQNNSRSVPKETEKRVTIELSDFSPKARKLFSKADPRHLTVHKRADDCKEDCPFYRRMTRSSDRARELSILNLYALVLLALNLCDEDIQLGDMLRWIREEHLTYGDYSHFFPEDMHLQKSDRMHLMPFKLSHYDLRCRARRIVRCLKISSVPSADIGKLIGRYVREYNLPERVLDHALRLLAHKFPFKKTLPLRIPSYEAVALAYIIVVLKLLFGLDGSTENEISATATKINGILGYKKGVNDPERELMPAKSDYLFVWSDWTRFVNYRKILLTQYHYPSAMMHDHESCDNAELFLHHKKTTSKVLENEKTSRNFVDVAAKAILESMSSQYGELETKFPTFSPTLTPKSFYTREILSWTAGKKERKIRDDIILEDFSNYNTTYTLEPENLKKILENRNYHVAIDRYKPFNFITDERLVNHLVETLAERTSLQTKKYAECEDCELSEFLVKVEAAKLNECVIPKMLKEEKEEKQMITLKTRTRRNIRKISGADKKTSKEQISLRLCYPNYWLRHYKRVMSLFSIERFEKELDLNFPPSFSWLMREFAAHAEISTVILYRELTYIEQLLLTTTNPESKK